MRRLYVLRHAKSSWDDSSLDDHDRPLAGRGRKAIGRIAHYVEQNKLEPDLVLCSTARRARDTLAGLGAAVGGARVEFDDGIYLAAASDLTGRLNRVDDGISSVMVIGHNPGLADLVLTLAGTGPDLPRVRTKFPTAALATLAFEGAWEDLRTASAELVDYVVPRDLK
jgi:phosphohistidine phosphatase